MLYFDHNATAPLLPAARTAWIEAAEKFIGNPSSPHRLGARADAALGEAREGLAEFDKLGFAVSTGSACASGREKPSHVLAAMHYPKEASSRVLRFSSGWETTETDWHSLLEGLRHAHSQINTPVS